METLINFLYEMERRAYEIQTQSRRYTTKSLMTFLVSTKRMCSDFWLSHHGCGSSQKGTTFSTNHGWGKQSTCKLSNKGYTLATRTHQGGFHRTHRSVFHHVEKPSYFQTKIIGFLTGN